MFWILCPENVYGMGVADFPNDSNILMAFVGVVPFYQITDLH